MWTTCRSRSTRCSRRSASASCTARSTCSESSRPFLYGGDMIAQGQVFPDRVAYNVLPWKFGAGTPNILGTVVSAQALRLLIDLARSPRAYQILRQRPCARARRGHRSHDGRHARGRGVSPRTRWRVSAKIPGPDDVRSARGGAPDGARLVQRRRPGSDGARGPFERRGRRVARGLPLRHARAPPPRPRSRPRAAG